MNRNDWMFVGIRLFGLYLIVSAILDVPTVLLATTIPDGTGLGVSLLTAGLSGLIGVALMLGAPHLLRWLGEKDSRVGVRQESMKADAANPRS